jgi:hypothetical protein
VVEDEVLKPNSSVARILLVTRWFISLIYIIFSRIFENGGNVEIGL